MHKECPKCGAELVCDEDDPSVGIVGGWFCPSCDYNADRDVDDCDDLFLDLDQV